MIDEHVQESAVEGLTCDSRMVARQPTAVCAEVDRGHALAHCCAVLASANPIGRVCVCVKTQVECEFQFAQKDSCVSAGPRPPGMGGWRPRSETARPRDTEKRKANDGFDTLAIIAGIIYSNLRSRT